MAGRRCSAACLCTAGPRARPPSALARHEVEELRKEAAARLVGALVEVEGRVAPGDLQRSRQPLEGA